MKARIFAELPPILDMTKVRLKTGDKFLTGTKVIAQQETKKIGDEITYYVVTNADELGKNVSYKPVYDKMEE